MSTTLPPYTVAAAPPSSPASTVTIEEFSVEPTFETHANGSWTVVNVQGELDLSTSAALRAAVEGAASGDGAPRVAVDLTGVTFMDSSSLGVLVACLKELGDRGGEMRLVGVSGSPAKVIALTGLDAAFTIDASVDDLPA
jgi:anti-sigma B factor antagonist